MRFDVKKNEDIVDGLFKILIIDFKIILKIYCYNYLLKVKIIWEICYQFD